MDDKNFAALESKIDDLIHLCGSLEQENKTLKARQDAWEQERAQLMEKNDLARNRVEAMINHLKTLDQQE